jgi:hypothetical protein
MVIKASAAGEIRQLIDALGGGDEVRREAAIARLAIIGPRAVDRLIAAYRSCPERETRIAILRALEPLRDRRVLPAARAALSTGGDEAIAAANALRGLLDAEHAATAAGALDALVATALDASAERRVRLAAFGALQEMPAAIRERVTAALGPRAGIAARPDAAASAAWADALDGRLPDDPAALRVLVQDRAQTAPLGELRMLIDLVREREQAARKAAGRTGWQSVRGALHQALALRGSRIALYDLRETLEGLTAPLPASFLTALHTVGDESCLAPLAAAHAGAPANSAWRHQLAVAFHAIAKRERITKRSAVIKKIAARWPEILAAAAPAGR